MSSLRSARAILAGLLLVSGAALLPACSSSSSSAEATALCNDTCNKYNTCFGADAGPFTQTPAQCKATCMSSTTTSNGGTCTNQAEIIAAARVCLAKSCDELFACGASIPECQGGSTGGGQGGSSGGGLGGANGGGQGGSSGGNPSCSICDKAGACCTAFFTASGLPTTSCVSMTAATCNSLPAQTQDSYVMSCMTLLTNGAAQTPAIVACH